jgi:transcriptional regulator with XRE-family HTH domain
MHQLSELGHQLALLRKSRGLTQKQLAAYIGMGQSTLARFETGRVAEFGSRKLLRLLEVLGHEMAFVPAKTEFTLDDALAERQRDFADESETPR